MPNGLGARGNLRALFFAAYAEHSRRLPLPSLGIRQGSAQTPREINAGVTMPLLDPSPIYTSTGMFHVKSLT